MATVWGSKWLLIKGCIVVNDDCMRKADVLVEQSTIREVGTNISAPSDAKTINADGLYLMPGGIDMQTNLQTMSLGCKSADDFYTGTQAAIAGGTTMIVDSVNTVKGQSLVDAFSRRKAAAEKDVCCSFSSCIDIVSWSQKIGNEMEVLSEDYGVNAFKCIMGCEGVTSVNDGELYNAFSACQKIGAIAHVHGSNPELEKEAASRLIGLDITGPEGHVMSNNEEVEAESVHRAAVIANQATCPLQVDNIASQMSADVISACRKRGMIVYGCPTAAALGSDGSSCWSKDWGKAASHVTSPTLHRDVSTQGRLIASLAVSDLQLTSSGHRTFTSSERNKGKGNFTKIPRGVNGIEDRMSVIWEQGVNSGRMDACQFVSVTSSTAAKILNIYPKKGRIAIGSDADFILFDPRGKRTISAKSNHETCDSNIFEGMQCHGVVMATIYNGKVAYQNGKVLAVKGSGKCIQTKPFSPFVYDKILRRYENRPQGVERHPPSSLMTPGKDNSMQSPNGRGNRNEPMSPLESPRDGEQCVSPKTFNQSSFKLSGEQLGDDRPIRTNLKQQGQRETQSHIILG